MQLSVDSRRPIRHCSCRSGSVASLPLPPAAECLYRWADQRDEVVIVPNLQTRERKQRASPATARSVVVFPGAPVPVEIGRLPSLKLVADLAGRGVGLLLGTQRDPDVEEPAREDLYDVCVKGALVRLVRATEQRWTLIVRGLRRCRIVRVVRDSPYLVATSDPVHEGGGDEFPLRQLSTDLESAVDKLFSAGDVPAAAVEAVRASGDIDLSDL